MLHNLKVIWDALHAYREDLIPEGDQYYDGEWNEICTAMSHIHEALGVKHEEID